MRLAVFSWLVGIGALGTVACGDDGAAVGPGATTGGECADPAGCEQPLPVACAAGFQSQEGDVGCEPVLPAAACPAGSRPDLGSSACVAVGPGACPAGFAQGAEGWGCAPILPAAACSGATMEVLGETTCRPIGDCGAAFPPADATLFVDDDYGPEDLDATHFATLADALAVATAGAVIAIESGTYVGKLGIEAPIALVGRCAEEVTITSPDQNSIGFLVTAQPVLLKGLHFVGHEGGLVTDGAEVDVEECLFEGNFLASILSTGAGGLVRLRRSVVRSTTPDPAVGSQVRAVLVQHGARVEIEESAIVGNEFANVAVVEPGSSALIHRTVVSGGVPQTSGPSTGSLGVGLMVQNGADLAMTESAVFDNHQGGVVVGNTEAGAGPTANIERSVVERTHINPTTGLGRGVEVGEAATVTLVDSTLRNSEEFDLLVTAGSQATVRQVAVVGPLADPSLTTGVGIMVSEEAHADLENVAIAGGRYAGFQLQYGGTASMRQSLVTASLPPVIPIPGPTQLFGMGINQRPGTELEIVQSSLVGNVGVGLLVSGDGVEPGQTRLTADGLLIDDTRVDSQQGFGRGMSVQDGTQLTLLRSAVLRSHEVGVMVTDAGTTLALTDTVIRDVTAAADGRFGQGLLVLYDGYASAERVTIHGAASAGITVASASGFVTESAIASNLIGVQVQFGTTVLESDAPPSDARTLAISSTTVLVANEAKFGEGELPLPTPVGAEH